MVTVRIGSESREGIDERWINDQLTRRQRDKEAVCVEVVISELSLRLATPECGGGGGGGQLTPRQQEIADLWRQVLGTKPLGGGNLVAFLNRLKQKGL